MSYCGGEKILPRQHLCPELTQTHILIYDKQTKTLDCIPWFIVLLLLPGPYISTTSRRIRSVKIWSWLQNLTSTFAIDLDPKARSKTKKWHQGTIYYRLAYGLDLQSKPSLALMQKNNVKGQTVKTAELGQTNTQMDWRNQVHVRPAILSIIMNNRNFYCTRPHLGSGSTLHD